VARDDRGVGRRPESLGQLRHRRGSHGEGGGLRAEGRGIAPASAQPSARRLISTLDPRPSALVVLGIDPGTASTGYGVVRGDGIGRTSLVECGVIRTRPRDPLSIRLREIHEGVAELIARHNPDALAVEDVFYAKNVRTTVVLGHARGVILLAGEQAKLAIHE